MAECSRHPEAVSVGELILDASALQDDQSVMFRARGEVFACTHVSYVFEEGRYVLMLDGESRG